MEEKRYRKIYVLELENKKFQYYVGHTSKTMENIFKDHLQGGRALTKYNQPIRIVEVSEIGLTGRTEADMLTTNKVIECMGKYGIENVRGGRFTSLNVDYHLRDAALFIDHSIEFDNGMAFLAPQLEEIRKKKDIMIF